MSTATLAPSVKPSEARPVHSFRGGPFDGRTYSHWKRCPLDDGRTALAMFPHGSDIAAAIAWGLADFRASEGGYASTPRVAVYRQADLGACPRIRLVSGIGLGFPRGIGLSASAPPSARTIPINPHRHYWIDAKPSEDCAPSRSIAIQPIPLPALVTETCGFLAPT